MRISKKVCLLGDFAVGKTSLVRRFVYDIFDDNYISTIGVKVSRKLVEVPHGDEVVEMTMMLWDMAGSEDFNWVRTSYLRDAAGAILVCDLTRPATLINLETYVKDLRDINADVRLILAANKHDLTDQRKVTTEEIESVAGSFDAPCFLTSAKTGEEVEALFQHLSRLLLT